MDKKQFPWSVKTDEGHKQNRKRRIFLLILTILMIDIRAREAKYYWHTKGRNPWNEYPCKVRFLGCFYLRYCICLLFFVFKLFFRFRNLILKENLYISNIFIVKNVVNKSIKRTIQCSAFYSKFIANDLGPVLQH